MSAEVPDGADSFGPFGGFGGLVEQKVSVQRMHELRSNSVELAVFLEENGGAKGDFRKHWCNLNIIKMQQVGICAIYYNIRQIMTFLTLLAINSLEGPEKREPATKEGEEQNTPDW